MCYHNTSNEQKIPINLFSKLRSQIYSLRQILQLENWSLIGSRMFFNRYEVDQQSATRATCSIRRHEIENKIKRFCDCEKNHNHGLTNNYWDYFELPCWKLLAINILRRKFETKLLRNYYCARFIMEDNNFIILRNFREITHLDYRSDRFYLKREWDERFLPFTIIKVLEIKNLI